MTNPSPSSAVFSLIHHFQARCGQLAVMVERHLHLDRLLPHLQASRTAPLDHPVCSLPYWSPPRIRHFASSTPSSGSGWSIGAHEPRPGRHWRINPCRRG